MANLLSNTTIGGYQSIHTGNIGSYAITSGNIGSQSVSYASNSGALNGWAYTSYAYRSNGNGYYQVNDWVQMNGNYGIFWPNNYGLHLYPNQSSYGALQINGSKNGWSGIYFYDSQTTLMMNSNESGHYRDGYGWQYRWYNGAFYITTAAQGGGTEYLALHTGNIGSYALTSLPSHNHDDRYYTESESDSRFIRKNTWEGNSYIGTGGDIYGTVFYDSNDTTYYVDPSSYASRLKGLAVGENYYNHTYPGIVQSGSTNYNYNWYNGSWSGSVTLGYLANCSDQWEFGIHDSGQRVVSAFLFDGGGNNKIVMGRDLGWGATYIEAASSFRAPIFYDSADTNYYLDANSTSRLYRVDAVGEMRAPIFYDSQDTSYYVDPNSSSRVNRLWVDKLGGIGTYSWVNAALTTSSIEIVNQSGVNGSLPPTLAFHWYGDGGPQFRLAADTSNILYLESAAAGSANTATNSTDYFNSLRLICQDSTGLYVNGNGVIHSGNIGSQSVNYASSAGNAATATTFSTNRTNYKGTTDNAVAGQLMWKNYGNNHTIFDASASSAPDGSSINNTNAQNAWSASYPTLMGWNGGSTYGVRVDSARTVDSVAWNSITGKPSGSTGLMQYGDFVNQVTFAGRTTTFHPSVIKTLLWGGNGTRYTVTDSYTGTYPQAGSTWVRTYELIDGSNSVYSSGNIYCGFWNNYPPANITVRVQNTSGTWSGPYQGSNIGVGYFEYWRIPCGGPNFIKKWEITFTPQAGLGINLITTDIVIDNDEGIDQTPLVSRGGSSMYGNLSFVGSGNTTNLTLNTSGVIVFPNTSNAGLSNSAGDAGFRLDDPYGNIYTWNTSGGYYVDANSYYFRSTGSSNWMTINSGTVQASADFRAPIFYDSNDTNYYIDPNGTSNLRRTYLTASGNDWYLNLNGLTLTTISTGETIWRNLSSFRFSDVNDWDYNSWAGLKFINSTKQIVLGVAGNVFTANSPQTGTLLLDRIATVYVNNTSQVVWHSGNFTDNSSNWNTAYSWGNHASAGYQSASTAITTSNIGSQSVSYASSAGSVAWTNVSSRPTALSQFTNDSAFLSGASDVSINSLTLGRGAGNYSDNAAFGLYAVYANSTGRSLTGIGHRALQNNTTGNNNTALGSETLINNTTGSNNVGIGAGAMNTLTTGGANVAIGSNAAYSMNGSYNVAIGQASLFQNTSNSNVSIGYYAGFTNIGGQNNIFIGYQAGYNETGSNKLYISNSNTYDPLIGGNFSNQRVTINLSPNNADASLHILSSGTTSSTKSLIVNNNAGNYSLVVLDNGNVGCGTDQPVGQLNVFGGVDNNPGILTIQSQSGGGGNTGIYFRPYQNKTFANTAPAQATILAVDASYSAHLTFSTKTPGSGSNPLVERMRLSSTGNLLIGTTTNGSYQLDVTGTGRFTSSVTASNYITSSDQRLKDNITPIVNSLNKIKSISGVEFDWNSGSNQGTHDVGLIAQEVEVVLPEAVGTQDDGYKTLAYSKVIPLLVEAMKEQQAMIDALKAEIEILKNK